MREEISCDDQITFNLLEDVPMVRAFWHSQDGNVAVTFTIALLPLLTAVGGAVDYTLTSLKAAELQSALDSAALAIATKLDSGLSRDELATIGEDQFRANTRQTAETATFSYIDPSSIPMLMAAAND